MIYDTHGNPKTSNQSITIPKELDLFGGS